MARNKITIGGVTEELNDARLPASLGTAGQVLKMNSDATGIEWGEAGGGGGSHLYLHSCVIRSRLSNQGWPYGYINCKFYTNSADLLGLSGIASFLTTNGFNRYYKSYDAIGEMVNATGTPSQQAVVVGIYSDNGSLSASFIIPQSLSTSELLAVYLSENTSITEIVVQLS